MTLILPFQLDMGFMYVGRVLSPKVGLASPRNPQKMFACIFVLYIDKYCENMQLDKHTKSIHTVHTLFIVYVVHVCTWVIVTRGRN